MRFLCLLIVLPFSLFAQSKGWQELTISDGLSQGMIFDLKQDTQGFIWVATKDGLNRYDGHNFKVFTHDPYNDFSLSGNNCSALLIDSHNRLWVGTLDQGLNLFDDKTQRFFHITISDQTGPNAGNYNIRLLSEDPEGNIWIGTDENKLFRISLPASLASQLPDHPDLTSLAQLKQITLGDIKKINAITSIRYSANGQAFVGSSYGIHTVNWQHPVKTTRLGLLTDKLNDFHAVDTDPQQDFWFASTSSKIIGWHKGQQKIVNLPKDNYFGVQLKLIDKKILAIATPDHLWLMSPTEFFGLDKLTGDNAFVALPPGVYSITSLLKDQTGNIWVGTSGYGLRKFNPKIKQFHSYLPGTSLSSMYVDRQGRTYIRYQYAYGLFDRAANQLVPFLDKNLPDPDKRQRYMMQARTGFFWISNTNFETHKNHLFKFSSEWKLLRKFPLPANIDFGFFGNQTIEDRSGVLWIGATNGNLLRFNPKSETFDLFSYQALLPKSGAEIETYALHLDQLGILWIGTQQGLIKATQLDKKPTFSIYKNTKIDRQSLSNDFVSSVHDDPYQPARYLWVSTRGGGLERLDKQTGHFRHFTEAQGLPNKVVYGIQVDAFNNLWLSTNRGLAQFNSKTFKFRRYTKADGLQDDEFNSGSYVRGPSGELLFGGVNGLTAFRTEEIAGKTGPVPQAHIIELKINNEPVVAGGPDGILSMSIERTKQLDLTHTQNLLTLEFGVMDYTDPTQNRYRYRLEGIDKNWIEAGTNRLANYARLPSGDYRLAMMGSADGDVWSKPVELRIRVHPPFYLTWWAYLVYVVVGLVLGWQLYRFQTQRLLLQQQIVFEQKETSRLAELDGLKTQFFTNISHEFRTPLTLILSPLDELQRRFPNETVLGMMERNGHRLLSLINQLLDLSKLEAGQLKPNPEPGDIAAFFRALTSSFGSLAESRLIQFSFTQNESEWWANFDQDKIEKIVINLLANAFKFTPPGKEVSVRIQYPESNSSGVLTLIVQDTGIGIAATNLAHIFERFYQVDGNVNRSYEGTGIGLALVNELVHVLKGTIYVTSTVGVGTTFTITLPLVASQPYQTEALPQSSLRQEPRSDNQAISSPETVSAQDDSHSPQATTENILLVIDDNADIRTYIRSVFGQDYQIIEAEDGQDGLEKATVNLPDMVICDLMMPRLDGFGFCQALKSQEATSHIPVVMLTARAGVEDRIEGFSLGADDYLTKPFNRAELIIRVQNLVQKQARLRQYFSGQRQGEAFTPKHDVTRENAFLQKVQAVVDQHLSENTFNVDQLSQSLNLSPRQVVRKIKMLTDQTAVEFIRNRRLELAAELLIQRHSVSEVAYQVGFESLSYFTKVFQDKFGVLPSAYGHSQALP